MMNKRDKSEFSVLTKMIILMLTIIGTFVVEDFDQMPILFLALIGDFLIQKKWKLIRSYLPLYIILTIIRWISRTYRFPIIVFSEFYLFIFWWLTPIFMAMHDLMTTSPGIISAFLSRLRIPKPFILGILITCRFIPTLKSAIKGVGESMHNRRLTGFKNILFHPIKSYEYVLVPMLMMSLNIADQLSASAVVRGVEAPCTRGSYYQDKMSIKDGLGMIIIVGVFGYIIIKGGYNG